MQQHKRAPAAGPAPQRLPGRCGTASSRPFLLLASTLAAAALLLLSGAVQVWVTDAHSLFRPPPDTLFHARLSGAPSIRFRRNHAAVYSIHRCGKHWEQDPHVRCRQTGTESTERPSV